MKDQQTQYIFILFKGIHCVKGTFICFIHRIFQACPSGHKLSFPNSAAEPISQATHRAGFRIVFNVFETRAIQKQLKICTLSPLKMVRRGIRNVTFPKSTESLNFKLRRANQRKWMKGMPIPHLAKESTGAEASLLSKPTVTIDQK